MFRKLLSVVRVTWSGVYTIIPSLVQNAHELPMNEVSGLPRLRRRRPRQPMECVHEISEARLQQTAPLK